MLKRAIVTLLVLGISSFLSAGENTRQISDTSEVFIGVEAGAAFVQGDTALEPNHEGTSASIGIRFGAQNQQWRSMLIVDYSNNTDDNQKYERGMIQVDYFIPIWQMGNAAFKPYVGINGGYMNYESTGIDESGFTYGAQIGFTAGVSDTIDLDVAYRYSVASPDAIDNIGNVVVGINYLY